jgi:hypothetical protein
VGRVDDVVFWLLDYDEPVRAATIEGLRSSQV